MGDLNASPLEYSLPSDRPVFQIPQKVGSKRPRVYDVDSDEDDLEDLEAETFDPDSFYKRSRRLKIPKCVELYINDHFRSCLSSEARRGMAIDNPLPHLPALTAPEADDVIVDFMGQSFPGKMDTQLKRVQSAILAAAAPMLNLWAQLEEQNLTSRQGGLVPVEVVLETFQKPLVLLGNSSNYNVSISQRSEKRKANSPNRISHNLTNN